MGKIDAPVNYHRSRQSIRILSAVMRMIPAGPVQAGIERVRKGAARCNGTLLNGWHAIKPRCLILQKAMPVERGSLFGPGDLVGDSDFDVIAPIRFDCWPGDLAIDHDDTSIDPVRSFEAAFDDKIIFAGHSCYWWLLVRIGVECRLRTPRETLRKWLKGGLEG